MEFSKHLFTALLVGATPVVTNAGLFGPGNYDDCILESMRGVTSNAAAGAISRACRAKFPVKTQGDSLVPVDVLRKIDGRAGYSYGFFRGSIYNGNKEWTITQVTIVLSPKSKSKTAEQTSADKEYNVNVTIPPLTNVDFIESVSADGVTDFGWNISSARGYLK